MVSGPAFGCIADDYTGATDVAAAFRRGGLRTVLVFGQPAPDLAAPDCDALIVALKSRTIPAGDAVARSLGVKRWLTDAGARRFYFKYCSTFDSTDAGNIGPVTDALLDDLGSDLTLICPATPMQGRTIYQGHLFVGDRLLSESSMRSHPLTPMTDSDLVAVLGRQTPHRVGLLAQDVVRSGAGAVASALTRLRAEGVRHVVCDAISADDLEVLARGAATLPLITGAAGLAEAAAVVQGGTAGVASDVRLPEGRTLILAGSLSARTAEQIEAAQAVMPSFDLDPLTMPSAAAMAEAATSWLKAQGRPRAALISSGSNRAPAAAADQIERAMGTIACRAVESGVTRLVVAGGETSGSVVEALGVGPVEVGGEEDRGVPWIVAVDRPLALLLKSGNFGGIDLFGRAAAA